MREILFRGKQVYSGEWLYGMPDNEDCSADFPCISPSRNYHTKDTFPLDWEVDPATVGQFTGLYDKNGRKIFEGDIVEYNDGFDYFKGEVVFENGAFGVGSYEVIGFSSGYCDNFANLWQLFWNQEVIDEAELYYCVVIGNIHDNPELMEAQS